MISELVKNSVVKLPYWPCWVKAYVSRVGVLVPTKCAYLMLSCTQNHFLLLVEVFVWWKSWGRDLLAGCEVWDLGARWEGSIEFCFVLGMFEAQSELGFVRSWQSLTLGRCIGISGAHFWAGVVCGDWNWEWSSREQFFSRVWAWIMF
jgi:hypothetical protein